MIVMSATSTSAATSRPQGSVRATWGRLSGWPPRSAALISRQTKPASSTVPSRLIPVAHSVAVADSQPSDGST